MLIVAEPSWSGDKADDKKKDSRSYSATLSQAKVGQSQSRKNKTVQDAWNTIKATILQPLTDEKQLTEQQILHKNMH